MSSRWSPRRILRRLVLRVAEYLEIPDNRKDPRYRSSQISRGVSLGRAVLEGNNLICEDCFLIGDVKIGYASTLGPRCIVHGDVSIGRYSQLASAVALYAVDHGTDHLTTYVSKPLFDGDLRQFSQEQPIVVGSDVWIGHGAIILKGVRIGHGAVIGAGSVVTHDVPAYGVAAGNPARLLRMRFDDDVIELLEALEWWTLEPSKLEEVRQLFYRDFVNDKARSVDALRDVLAHLGRAARASRKSMALQ